MKLRALKGFFILPCFCVVQGRKVFEQLKKLESRGVKLQIAVNAPQTSTQDTAELSAAGRNPNHVPATAPRCRFRAVSLTMIHHVVSGRCTGQRGEPERRDWRHRSHQALGRGPEAFLPGQR